MSERLLRIPLFLVLFCCHDWANADTRTLQVELIVFEQRAPTTESFRQTETKITPVQQYAPAQSGVKTMNFEYSRLSRAGSYRPFYYQSWRIPVSSERVSLPIHIASEVQNLQGWIKIQRGNLLHVVADLEYSPSKSKGLIYRIAEKRRILLNEVHFLDHPYFGVLLKVSPVE
ncbi:MAG: peptidoglycan binding protein CsiV [Methylococcaceae bacterium]|nr:peptidoglycan binding protein CsiV [Methylococcaceae bacterium]